MAQAEFERLAVRQTESGYTHIALWAIDDSPRLPAQARELIVNPKHAIWTSVASLWEIAIKHSRNSDDMSICSADALKYFQLSGYRILPIQAEHTLMMKTLPCLFH